MQTTYTHIDSLYVHVYIQSAYTCTCTFNIRGLYIYTEVMHIIKGRSLTDSDS